jgi:hypothetical protein
MLYSKGFKVGRDFRLMFLVLTLGHPKFLYLLGSFYKIVSQLRRSTYISMVGLTKFLFRLRNSLRSVAVFV